MVKSVSSIWTSRVTRLLRLPYTKTAARPTRSIPTTATAAQWLPDRPHTLPTPRRRGPQPARSTVQSGPVCDPTRPSSHPFPCGERPASLPWRGFVPRRLRQLCCSRQGQRAAVMALTTTVDAPQRELGCPQRTCLRVGPYCRSQGSAERQVQSLWVGPRRQTTSASDPWRRSESLSGTTLPMAATRSLPTAFQSIPIACWSTMLGGSGLAGGFKDPVKSKMRAMPSQAGLRSLSLTVTFRLALLCRWGLGPTSVSRLALTAISSLPMVP